MDTVADLKNRDYTVVVPVLCVADFDPEMHSFALKRMEKVYGAKIVTELPK
jgi:nicotinamidase-related amidase